MESSTGTSTDFLLENHTTERTVLASKQSLVPQVLIDLEIAYLVCIAIISIPGNTLIVLLQLKNHDKISTDYLVMTMAIFEGLYTCCLTPIRLFVNFPNFWKTVASDALCRIEYSMLYVFPMSSAWFLGVIAIDRYFKTCKPLFTGYTTGTAKKVCLAVSFSAIAIGIPALFTYELKENSDCDLNQEYSKLMFFVEFIVLSTIMIEFGVFVFTYTSIGLALKRRHAKKVLAKLTASHANESVNTVKSGNIFKRLKSKVSPLVRANVNEHLSVNSNKSETNDINVRTVSDIDDKSSGTDNTKGSNAVSMEKHADAERRKRLLAEKALNRTTRIMFLLTVVRVVIWTVSLTATMARRFIDSTAYALTVNKMSHTLPMFNCITNPVFFFVLSSKFRMDAKKLFTG